MNNEPIYLKYIGNGHSLHGIPARDMTKKEADGYVISLLIDSRLYKLVEEPKPVIQPKKSKLDDEKGD